MNISSYRNFDLEIARGPEPGQFRARVHGSPEGETDFAAFEWPFESGEEDAVVRAIYGGLAIRGGVSVEQQRIQDFGARLFDAVFRNEVGQLYRRNIGALLPNEGLRLRLRLPPDAQAHNTPWEFLFDSESSEFLAVQERTPVVRYLSVARAARPLLVKEPLRILVAISSPRDYQRLNVEREWSLLNEALNPSIDAGRIALRRVEGRCTFDNLRDALRSEEAHVFHFIGHGEPGSLILERDSGHGVDIDVVRLRAAFPGGALPRLVVLNACAGAISERDAVFSGVAQSFLKQGVPAVVGMQASITDEAAMLLTRYFYREIAGGAPVDSAITEARLRLQGNGNVMEWGTPVLYMRAPDGRLFEKSPDAPSISSLPPEQISTKPRTDSDLSVSPIRINETLSPTIDTKEVLPLSDDRREIVPAVREALTPTVEEGRHFFPKQAHIGAEPVAAEAHEGRGPVDNAIKTLVGSQDLPRKLDWLTGLVTKGKLPLALVAILATVGVLFWLLPSPKEVREDPILASDQPSTVPDRSSRLDPKNSGDQRESSQPKDAKSQSATDSSRPERTTVVAGPLPSSADKKNAASNTPIAREVGSEKQSKNTSAPPAILPGKELRALREEFLAKIPADVDIQRVELEPFVGDLEGRKPIEETVEAVRTILVSAGIPRIKIIEVSREYAYKSGDSVSIRLQGKKSDGTMFQAAHRTYFQ